MGSDNPLDRGGGTSTDRNPNGEEPTTQTSTPAGLGSVRRTIGPYRLLQKLGEGGMGEVFLVEQAAPLQRRVALKLLRGGMDTGQVVARFDAERQALALMDHPGIARVYDAGATEDCPPYFVMEYVPGLPIDRFCSDARLASVARLELFASVCDAVQHAHQKGVIHRDLKPSNILVRLQDDRPLVKIIDFGIAKAITHQLTDHTLVTEYGTVIGTPEYMSPEQAGTSPLDVDTRSDVYSLGVVLYELLVGVLPLSPHELRQKGLASLQRRLREREPTRPSLRVTQLGAEARAAAEQRGTDPRALASWLRSDLEWITMKALERDRSRRYSSVSELASDVRRHIAREPVSADPPGAAYRIGKFLRRHRAGAAAIVRFLQSTLGAADPYEAGRGSRVADSLKRAARQIEGGLPNDPATEAAIRDTISRTLLSLSLYDEAERQLEQALLLRRSLSGPDHESTLLSTVALAELRYAQGRYEEASRLLQDAVARSRAVLGSSHPTTIAAELSQAAHMTKAAPEPAGIALESLMQRSEAALGRDDLQTLNAMTLYAAARQERGDFAGAEQIARQVLAACERALPPGDPTRIDAAAGLASILEYEGKYAEAEPLARNVLAERERVFGPAHLVSFDAATILIRILAGEGKLEDGLVRGALARRLPPLRKERS